MSPLDELYGKGTSAAFSGAVTFEIAPKPKVEQFAQQGNGYVRVNVTWGKRAEMKIDCRREEVVYLHLASKAEGLYDALTEALPALFAERGVVWFSATTTSNEATAILKKRGDWHGRRRLKWQVG